MRVVSASGLRLRRHIHRHLLFPMTWHVLRRLWEDALSCLLPILCAAPVQLAVAPIGVRSIVSHQTVVRLTAARCCVATLAWSAWTGRTWRICMRCLTGVSAPCGSLLHSLVSTHASFSRSSGAAVS